MNVILSPEAQKIIRDQMDSGQFDSPDQVVEEALHKMQAFQEEGLELDEETIAAIDRAEAQFAQGKGVDFGTFAAGWRKRIGRTA